MTDPTLHDGWLGQDGPAAIVLSQQLMPVEGPGGVIFPATFAASEDGRFKGGYNIDEFPDGTNVCLVDSVGSQANRIEPLFAEEKYRRLVPQVVIQAGQTRVNLLHAGHRAGDAIVRCSSLRDKLREAFTGAFEPAPGETIEERAFLGGETIGALLDRVLPAMARLQDDAGWQTALLVLHGGVNRALLSGWLCGGRAFLGRLEQSPACINIVDLGPGGQDAVLRAVNLSPTDWLQPDERTTTMERLLAQYAGGLTTR